MHLLVLVCYALVKTFNPKLCLNFKIIRQTDIPCPNEGYICTLILLFGINFYRAQRRGVICGGIAHANNLLLRKMLQ